jgi:hypothetical protein
MKKSTEKSLKPRPEVNLSTFSFLFAEIIQYYLQKDKEKFEENIQQLGSTLGPRIYEYIIARDKTYKKENNHEEITKIIHSSVCIVSLTNLRFGLLYLEKLQIP